ncbi:MAG: pyrimidine 5'-nucleotidase [Hyphomonadaceae bacterium]|nr:pyrimidine 5'-nucleotidase [Hyphomonadaceae bacterium]
MTSFSGIQAWVFDLDNTLYPTGATIYERIGARMTDYVGRVADLPPEAALELQERYFHQYGATLAGLVKHHGVDPHDFLHYVHDVHLDDVEHDAELAHLIGALPGPRIVFTNGGREYAGRVTARLGLDGLFVDLFDIEAAGFFPKPQPEAFEKLIARHGLDPRRTLFFEDTPVNLETAHALGFRTVLIAPAAQPGESFPEHIHHATDCLKSFIRERILPEFR